MTGRCAVSTFKIPEPDLQIEFYHRLQKIRASYLLDALLAAISGLEIGRIDEELRELVSNSSLQKMAGWGLRGEILFPVPYVLENHPTLLGYYRLLLGFSQKEFYGKRYGFSPFKTMEESGKMTAAHLNSLRQLCQALCRSSEMLAGGIGELSQKSVHELTLLTVGPQLRGGVLNKLGSRATRQVFELIQGLVTNAVVSTGRKSIKLKNAAGRVVRVEFASDPDICIREELPSGNPRNLVAIEIKGGKDNSNIHNRIGEAEKSHQKALKEGFVECWTIVGVTDLNMELARKETPTTDRFYHLDRLIDNTSGEFADFRENLLSRVGISD
jgi:hypothetical protein